MGSHSRLLILCLFLQLYGCYGLRKAISNLKDKFDVKQLKSSFDAFALGLIIQAFLIALSSFLYFYIAPNLERELKEIQALTREIRQK